ncbi:MAG TPA: geranylgeranyl reductase family protein [Acidobacteriaceae bacterium]|nr:geranylgeranyl reductase family protein [Acidobacteriaceae bacterium]
MHFDYDILIAGAGPAGCAAAYDLARAGKRVLLLDRRSFPRPKACACGLTRKTLKALRYSVDPVIERVCKEIVLQRAANLEASIADKSAEVRIRSRSAICAMAVRERFDDFCLQQTLAAGAQLRKIETIVTLRELPNYIELDIVTATGTETLRAPVLIGADGSNGQTRRLEHLLRDKSAHDWYTRGFALEALIPYAALPAQLPGGEAPHDLVFDFSPIPGGYGWLFPKGDHINIGVGAFAPKETRGDPSSAAASSSPKVGPTDALVKQVTRTLLAAYTRQKLGVDLPKEVTGQHLGMGGHLYVPHGRVLLAGDAAGLVDPLTGEGIHSAIVSGQAAAAAILETRDVAAAYARHLAPLQQTLAFSHRAAKAFYREPERGFRAMKLPFLRSLILKTYADGLPHTRLLTALARLV